MKYQEASHGEHFATSDRICKEPERRFLTSVSPVQWWRNERAGKVPRRIQIGARAVGWRYSELQAWVRGEWLVESPVLGGANE